MSNYAKLYWLTRLDYVNGLMLALAIVSMLAIILIVVFTADAASWDKYEKPDEVVERKKRRKKFTNMLKWLIPLGIFSVLVNCFLPDKKDAILIMAGGKTMDYIQSDTSLSKIPYQTTKIISEYLDKQLSEMKEKK